MVVAVGVTAMLNVPLPVPVAVAPLLKVIVHAPVAVTLPAILELAPAQTAVFVLVMLAVGRVLTVMVRLPVKPADTAVQFASTKDVMV